MIDPLQIFQELSKSLDEKTAHYLSETLGQMYEELSTTVTKSDLAAVEARLNAKIEGLTDRVAELAESQRRTDAKLELLTERVAELAKAQKRTEARVEELAEARLRTEEVVARLVVAVADNRKQIGGPAHTVGYTLENAAYRALPRLLSRDWDVEVKGRLRRDWYEIDGKQVEVNIIGDGTRKGERVLIIGESKSQLSRQAVNRFMKRRVEPLRSEGKAVFPVVVSHMSSQPDVLDYAAKLGVAVYLSYDFDE